MTKSPLQSLQVFRGVAALAVVAHHAALSTDAFVGTMPSAVSEAFVYGMLGVDFFFVLSGFIIMYAHFDDERTTGTLRRYAFKRLTRIFPAYWPVGLGLLALYVALPGASAGETRDLSLISSMLLIPANGSPALSVAWTLVHELMFYGVFLLFFASRRWLVVALLTWALVIVVSQQFLNITSWLRYPLSLLNIDFMFGVGAAYAVRSQVLRDQTRTTIWMGVILACFALWLMAPGKEANWRLLFALGLALIIGGYAAREQLAAAQWPLLMLLLGNASYSIYLVHTPLLSITQRVAGQMALTWHVAMLWGILLSVLAGWVYFRMIESPALRFFRSRPSAR